jgi:hypothetical protein
MPTLSLDYLTQNRIYSEAAICRKNLKGLPIVPLDAITFPQAWIFNAFGRP